MIVGTDILDHHYRAEVLADSVSPDGVRLVTLKLVYPRFIHSEMMTHRDKSRNAASSRAIPTERLIDQVRKDPFVPSTFNTRVKGMGVGEVTNTRYDYYSSDTIDHPLPVGVARHRQKEIVCGVGGHETGKENSILLKAGWPETVRAGSTYSQLADEIHSSAPADGTVTIITREFLEHDDLASVFTPDGAGWVSAEPRRRRPTRSGRSPSGRSISGSPDG